LKKRKEKKLKGKDQRASRKVTEKGERGKIKVNGRERRNTSPKRGDKTIKEN
jgi:hypothetical protein